MTIAAFDPRYLLLACLMIGGIGAYAIPLHYTSPPPFDLVCVDSRGVPLRDFPDVADAVGRQGKGWKLTTIKGETIEFKSHQGEWCRPMVNEHKYRGQMK